MVDFNIRYNENYMSTTIIAVIINLLGTVLPWLGISLAPGDLTTTVQVILAIATGAWIWYQRVSQGDVTTMGLRKAQH